LVNTTYFPRS